MESTQTTELLLVEDDPGTGRLLVRMLESHGYTVTFVPNVKRATHLLQTQYFPLVISDLRIGSETGLSLIPFTKTGSQPTFIIFLTGYGSIDTTVQALHEGAFEYLSKPNDLNDIEGVLIGTVQRALKQIAALPNAPKPKPVSASKNEKMIIGKSSEIVNIYRAIAKASLSKCNVIIFGESGTGKELVAHAIHDNSPLSKKPLVTINCGALTETLLESELFGHVKGSFTGAVANKRGLFEEADGGILFLDEIGDISLSLQVKLLRAIQEGEIRPVGSTENRKVNVRVISATHRDLQKMVDEGKFREDLYYRLKVIPIYIPPLRDRLEDLPELVDYFIQRIVTKGELKPIAVSAEAMQLLKRYPWPGNIRELENTLERAIAMSSSGTLFPEDFPGEILSYSKDEMKDASEPLAHTETSHSTAQSLDELEREHILRTLESVDYNKTKAAEILAIDRGTLYRRAQRYNISLARTKAARTPTPPKLEAKNPPHVGP